MANTRKIIQSGGSLSVTIPDFIVKELNLCRGQSLRIDFIDRKDGSERYITLRLPSEKDNTSTPPLTEE